MILKLEKHAKKRKTHGKSKSKTSKLKKIGSKTNGEKKERQKGENIGKHGFVHLHFLCIYFAFSIFFFFAFRLLLFLLFAWKKNKQKNKIKAKKSKSKKQNKSKKMQMDKLVHCFPIFSPFWLSFFFSCFPFFSFILLLCFLDFADLLFVCSLFFFAFVAFFLQVLKKLE